MSHDYNCTGLNTTLILQVCNNGQCSLYRLARMLRLYFIIHIRDATSPYLLFAHQHPGQFSRFVHCTTDTGHLSYILKSNEVGCSNCPSATHWRFRRLSGPLELISHDKLDSSNKHMDTQMGYYSGSTGSGSRMVHGGQDGRQHRKLWFCLECWWLRP